MTTFRSLLLVVFALTPGLLSAQWHGPDVPDSLSFQGYLTDPAGVAVPDGDYNLLFKMYKGSNKVWEASQPAVPVKSGVFNVILNGSVTWPLDTVTFNEPIDLGITINGGTELTPRTPLTSAAYALGMRGMYAVAADDGNNNSPNLVGGSSNNFVESGVVGAAIGGGGGSFFSSDVPNSVLGDWGTVGGGLSNTAGGLSAVTATVGGGNNNNATGGGATIGGGRENTANSLYATVPGGQENSARGYASLAAGYSARAIHDGSFVWNDRSVVSGNDSLVTTGTNQFLIRAAGGVGIGTNMPKPGVTISRESQAAAFQLELRNAGNITQTNYDGIAFTQMGTGSTVLASIKIAYHNNGRPDMSFSVRGAPDALFIESGTGDVGIGTKAPGSQLTVHGIVESDTLGFKFPDGSVQTSAASPGSAWSLTGNSGTTPGTNFVGTTDGAALEMRAGASSLIRLEHAGNISNSTTNLIGGSTNNFVGSGVYGATIGGGGGWSGTVSKSNSVLGNWGTVSGGYLNTAIGGWTTIGGGWGNTADGSRSTVPGGFENSARGSESFAAGFRAKAIHQGSFVWNDRSIVGGNDSLLTTGANQFLIRAAGGVGIGTNAPIEALHIKQASGSTGIFLGGDGTLGPHGIVFDDDTGGEGVQIFWRTGSNRLVLERSSLGTSVDGSDAFYYDRDVDVFGFDGIVIPIADDTHTLGTSSLRWSTVYSADGVVTTSDGRLKRDIEDIGASLKTVLKLRPVRYRWKDKPGGDHHLGLIAQEVEKVVPEVVSVPDSEDGYYGVNYGELVPVLIKAIQELTSKVESQRATIGSQRSKIAEFGDRLAAVEAAVTN